MKLLILLFALSSWCSAQIPARAKPVVQSSTGNCSPNIVNNGNGQVTVQITGCNGVDPTLLRMVTQQAQRLQKLLTQYPELVKTVNLVLSDNKELSTKVLEFEAMVKKFQDLGEVLEGLEADTEFRKDTAAALTAGDLDKAATLLEQSNDPVIKAKLAAAKAARLELQQVYPKVEQLIAIYSLVNWRSQDQRAPYIVRGGDYSEKAFELACKKIKWGSRATAASELFDCFTEKVKVYIPVADEEVETTRVSANEDFWYDFSWETLFGYPLKVTISPTPTQYSKVYGLRKEIEDTEGARCKEELGGGLDALSTCSFRTYVVRMSDLTYSKSVTFLVAEGYLTWLADGSVNRRDEWVVYLDDANPITIGSLNKSIQLIARQMQLKETDLSLIAPQLEMKWMDRTRSFVSSLFAELDKQPDLAVLTRFLKAAKSGASAKP